MRGRRYAVILAATIDLEGSGILQAWVEGFESSSGRPVELLTVPDEQAFAMARHGECDLILTHVYEEQIKLERANYVQGGQSVMRGDFVVVGPPGDPAGIRGMQTVSEAFNKIAETDQVFILRIDGSGTAYRSNQLWSISGAATRAIGCCRRTGTWRGAAASSAGKGIHAFRPQRFQQVGRGAGAGDTGGGDEMLVDIFWAAAVSDMTYPDANQEGAQEFLTFLLSEDARRAMELGAWEPPPE